MPDKQLPRPGLGTGQTLQLSDGARLGPVIHQQQLAVVRAQRKRGKTAFGQRAGTAGTMRTATTPSKAGCLRSKERR